MRRAPYIALTPDGDVFAYPAQTTPAERVIWLQAKQLEAERMPLRISKPRLAETIRDAAWAWVANENKRLTFVVTGCAVMLAVLIGQMAGV